MSVREIALLTLAQALGQAVGKFCRMAAPISSDGVAKARYEVTALVADSVALLAGYGLKAATAEFTAGAAAQTAFVSDAATLPPIV